jgi:peroxiredoxin
MNTPNRRLQDLERKFEELESTMARSPEKEALSVLHGIIQETQRATRAARTGGAQSSAIDIANLYHTAPAMEGPAVSTPLPSGTLAPDFILPDADARPVRLSDLRGRRLALVFYPLDWSPGCSQQLDLYQSEWNEFEARRVTLLAVSVDSVYSHGAWAAVRGLRIPLLADFHPKGEVARRYQAYRERDGFCERIVYVIDEAGVIRGHQLAPFLHHVPDLGELLTMIDAVPEVDTMAAPAAGVHA